MANLDNIEYLNIEIKFRLNINNKKIPSILFKENTKYIFLKTLYHTKPQQH